MTKNSNEKNVVLLMPEDCADRLVISAQNNGHLHIFEQANDSKNLKNILSKPVDYLFSFKTSIIVAPHLLKRIRRYAVNIHGGTPEFPGRDPHHFAVYHGAKLFGATAHYMNDLVDSGPIIDVKTFPVMPHFSPEKLMMEAEKVGWDLLVSCVDDFLLGRDLKPHSDWSWSGKKHTRKEFLQLCELTPEMPYHEMEKRIKACDVRGFDNMKIKISDSTYRLVKE